ncbi:MAG: hypothetical protein QM706_02345 [Nitrospira sp.]
MPYEAIVIGASAGGLQALENGALLIAGMFSDSHCHCAAYG